MVRDAQRPPLHGGGLRGPVPAHRHPDPRAPRPARGQAGDSDAQPPWQRRGLPLHRFLSHAPPALERGLKGIAVFEALKGALALLAATGMLYAIPRDFRHLAIELVGRLHLNAGKSYPNVFNRVLEDMSNAQLWVIAALVVVYAAVRFSEAYGLWRERAWAEWLAAVSGAIYIPLELYELSVRVTWIRLSALALNVAIVALMCFALTRRRRTRAHV